MLHLTRLTGKSQTQAVAVAVRERIERLRSSERPTLAERLLAMGEDTVPRLNEPFRSTAHGDLPYDESGLRRWSTARGLS